MITAEREAAVLRLYHAEKWRIGTIATQLGLHHSTVRRVLAQNGVPEAKRTTRPSMVDPYLSFIEGTLDKYPRLPASRLYAMVRERGYPGQQDHFRSIVARLRPRPPAEAFLRLSTLPGEQAQVDWGHFGKLAVGRAMRPLMAFVMVLSWSRMIFLRFYLGAQMPSFVRGHVDAFTFFDGVARVLLYDNLKSAVLERKGDAIRFHPKLVELASHYRFEPLPVAQYRGNEKGRVERAIRFVRSSFFAAREFDGLDDLNAQAHAWSTGLASERKWPDDRQRLVGDVFDEERPRLVALPGEPFVTHEIIDVDVGKTPYVRFDLNDYSVPHKLVRTTVTVVADLETVRITDGSQTIAEHRRTFDRGGQIEDPKHIAALVEQKSHARKHRMLDRLQRAVPSVAELLKRVAERGASLGAMTRALDRLLELHGATAVDDAVTEALARNAPHVGAIRQILDQRRRALGKPPVVATPITGDPRVRDLVVRPHALGDYDNLSKEDDDEEEPAG